MSKNAQNAGTIRKKPITRNGKVYEYWEARVTVGRDAGTGRQRQKSFIGKTQAEARKKMQSALAKIEEGTYFEPNKITVKQWLELWLKEFCNDVKYNTKKSYSAVCRTHIIPALGAVKLCNLKPAQIQAFYNMLEREGKTVTRTDDTGKKITERQPLSVKSIRIVHGVLMSALSKAVDMEYLRDNPAERVTIPKIIKGVNTKEIAPLTDEQVKLFLKEVEADEYKNILKTILFLGLREAEAIGLTWDCINFEENTVKVYQQWQKRPKRDGGSQFAPLKNNKQRTIVASPYVMDIFRQEKERQKVIKVRACHYWQGWQTEEEFKTALIFTTTDGNPINCTTLFDHYKAVITRVGCPNSCVHDLRHTYAVLSLQNGDDYKTVQENLGHATASFTLDVYGHVSKKMQTDSANRMQNYILGIS